jgi:general secretion pathway protein E
LGFGEIVMSELLNHWRDVIARYSGKSLSPSAADFDSILAECSTAAVDDDHLCRSLAEVLQVEWIDDLSQFEACQICISRIPISYCRQFRVIALSDSGNGKRLAIGNPGSLNCIDTVSRAVGSEVIPFFAPAEEVLRAIDRAYESRSSQTESVIRRLQDAEVDFEVDPTEQGWDLLDSSERAPVIQLVNSILFDAVRHRSSDVHIQPYAEYLQVRFRIDGMLFDQFRIHKSRQEEVLSRLKIIGKMNIAEKRLPQDGRATVRVGSRIVDMRIASLPSSHGERIVLRLLDKSARLYTLNDLGMGHDNLEQFRQLIHMEHGIVLVTGPTGAGKSTTLYAALQELNAAELNIVTLEDPIEYELNGVSQTQINEKKGLTFANGLRSVLRQDPDVIMVGEIRDQDTAKMAIQSALTGHLVFSTLHTNDAPSAVTRLLDLGIEAYLVASSVVGVLAQRLVREICGQCKTTDASQLHELSSIVSSGFQMPKAVSRGIGCDLCRETGFFGRIGLFELMIVDDEIRQMIQSRANASQIRGAVTSRGMQTLRADGIEKILSGRTTVGEVLRVSQAAPGDLPK